MRDYGAAWSLDRVSNLGELGMDDPTSTTNLGGYHGWREMVATMENRGLGILAPASVQIMMIMRAKGMGGEHCFGWLTCLFDLFVYRGWGWSFCCLQSYDSYLRVDAALVTSTKEFSLCQQSQT